MIKIKKIVLVLFLFASAFFLMMYPYIANYIFENRINSIVGIVEKSEEEIEDEERQKIKEKIKKYNETLYTGRIQLKDPFKEVNERTSIEKYNELLNMDNRGIMGILRISSINLNLPIYHGTSEKILEKGIGHLEGSSLPIGGENTHTVLTGHTGLSNAKLFTDLSELEEGENFVLNILGEKLVYKIDQIKIVLPDELKELSIKPGKDYCTLVTCTPYGVNTHRLLVRGKRVSSEEILVKEEKITKKKFESMWLKEYEKALKVSFAMLLVGIMILFFLRIFAKGKKRERRKLIYRQ